MNSDGTITVEICGMSGDGTIASGAILNTALSAQGLRVLAFDSYPAEIRGFGKCVTHGRFGARPVLTQGDRVDVLISLDDNYSREQLGLLGPGSVVLFDNRPPAMLAEGESIVAHVDPEVFHYGVPFRELSQQAMSSSRGKNLVALGALSALFHLEPGPFHDAIEKRFWKASDAVRAGNGAAFELGREYATGKLLKVDEISFVPLMADAKADDRLPELVSGQEAVARGAQDQGLAIYAGYPITPATPIMEILAKELPKRGGAVLQMEDEIASIGCVVGAGFGGKRAMTATSGPGLSLMTEMINLAVMAEVPAVIVDAQRGGPSTGLPTKTEQGDLNLCVFGGSGDSPRIVLAPTNVEQTYRCTEDAFWLSEKYQTPVILLIDFFLANRVESVAPLSPRDERKDGNRWGKPPAEGENFLRFAPTADAVSPRSVPGMKGMAHPVTGLEHTEAGLPNYTRETHLAMTEKRWEKIQNAGADAPRPEPFGEIGPSRVGVLAWGSTVGAATEAVELARAEGIAAAGLAVPTLWPFPDETVRTFIDRCDLVICPEGNRWGQFAGLAMARTGREVAPVLFPTGEPLATTPIYEAIRAAAGEAAGGEG